jgi:hypothetical protein
MSTTELRAHIVHRLTNISDTNVLKEINAMLDFKTAEPILKCTEEQRQAIMQAQQTIANGKSLSHEDVEKSVELCLNEN